jgi:NADH-quinone oxidoreductase subunit J
MLLNLQLTTIILSAFLASTTVAVVLYKSPIHSVLMLIIAIVIQAILFISLNFEFIGLLFIIIYVGAIVILFLFALMTINNLEFHSDSKLSILKKITAVFLSILALFAIIKLFNNQKINIVELDVNFNEIKEIGRALYGKYMIEFLSLGLFMLVSIVGIVSCCKEFLPSGNKNSRRIVKNTHEKKIATLTKPEFGKGIQY